MLPFKNRLTKRKDFREVYRKGTYHSKGPLAIKFTGNGTSDSRIGFAVEKRNIKKAAERNRAKRLLRESTRKLLKRVKPGFDIVVICNSIKEIGNIGKASPAIEDLFKKNNLLIEK